MFHEIDMIEAWGTGLLRIITQTRESGLTPPEFFHRQGAFVIKFHKSKKTNYKNGELNGELNRNQALTLKCITTNQGINAKELSEKLDTPFSTIDKHIRILLKKVLIKRKGSKKSGGYVVT
jgi:ATP-dependent DNA helicase RecG